MQLDIFSVPILAILVLLVRLFFVGYLFFVLVFTNQLFLGHIALADHFSVSGLGWVTVLNQRHLVLLLWLIQLSFLSGALERVLRLFL